MKEKRFKESFDILATIPEHVAEIWRFEIFWKSMEIRAISIFFPQNSRSKKNPKLLPPPPGRPFPLRPQKKKQCLKLGVSGPF
jgi:hypothetical protein